MNKILKMKNDIVFKAFFSKNERFLKSFLSAILDKNVNIKEVRHDVKLEQLAKEAKYGVLDLEVELENGEIINVEMQLKDNKNIEKRTTFYASKKIVEQMKPREDYANLNKVIIISILDYNLTDLSECVTETVRVAKTNKDYELNNIVTYYYIELPKFRNTNPDMNLNVNQWLSFIDMEREDLLDMAKKKNKEISDAIEAYDVLIGDDEIQRIAELRLMSELEERSALATARARGSEEGLKQGLQERTRKRITRADTKKVCKNGHEKGLQERSRTRKGNPKNQYS